MTEIRFDAVFCDNGNLKTEAELCLKAAQTLFDVNMPAEEIPVFGTETMTQADLDAAKSRGYICRIVSRGCKNDEGTTAYVEPCFMRPDDMLSVPGHTLYVTRDGETRDESELIDGLKAYSGDAEPTENNNTIDVHPYYIRTTDKDTLWYSVVNSEPFGDGILTKPVSAKAMHSWAEHVIENDPNLFFAAVM